MATNSNEAKPVKSYRRPELKVFGSVRNLTGGSSGSMSDGSGIRTLPMGGMSDPRAKENIVQVGSHPAGFGLYLFDFKPEFGIEGRQFGVMADEVAKIDPAAVRTGDDGYLRVDYDRLGIVLH